MAKYLIRREGKGYAFRIGVPAKLRPQFLSSNGHPRIHITIGLNTDSEREAQGKAAILAAQWHQQFKRAASGEALSAEEISEQAQEVYYTIIGQLERLEAQGLLPKVEPQDDPSGDPLEPHAAEIGALAIAHDLTAEALTDGAYRMVQSDIATVERRVGVPVGQGTATYTRLAQAILEAQMRAYDDMIRHLRGQRIEPPAMTWAPRMSLHTGVGFHVTAEAFMVAVQRKSGKQRSASTLRRYETAFRLFEDFNHNVPLAAIDRKMASSFLDTVARLDPHWGQYPKAKTLPLSALLKKFGQGNNQLSNAALNHYASSLKRLFDWAIDKGHMEGSNPFARQSREADDENSGWQPYTDKEISLLLRASKGPLHWLIFVAAYSGMRLGEICTSHIRKAHGIYFFDVTTAKTKAGIRRVPVHSALIEVGILNADYIGHLNSPTATKLFGRLRTKLEIGDQFGTPKPDCLNRRLSFHSLRGTFTTKLDEAGVVQTDTAMILGHARGFTFDFYSGGPGLKRLKEVVEKVSYGGKDA